MKRDYTPQVSKKGPKFTLYGREFHCSPMVPANVIISFTNLMVSSKGDDGEDEVNIVGGFKDVLAALDGLFNAAINIPEELAQWDELRNSTTEVIPITTLIEIGTDLADYYSTDLAGDERPTTPPSGGGSAKRSRRGASTAGASPTGSGVTTYSRSEPATTGR